VNPRDRPVAIEADGLVPAGREAVFAFLASLDRHWQLADRWIEVVSLDGDRGGRVRMRGPLGVHRTATTRVVESRAPDYLHGTASMGATEGHVTWTLSEAGEGSTRVRLEASVVRARPLDRLLLAAGGRLWLRRRLRATIAALARAVAVSPTREARA
jgi:polyketide cyclase/dehydrase/lipid transport protein